MTSEPATPSKKRLLISVLIPVVLILAAAWGALLMLRARTPAETGGALDVKVGAVLPDLEFHHPDGSRVALSKIRAKVILVNFWATWCEACMEEMPSLVKLYDTYTDKGVEIIGINLDDDPIRAILTTSREFGIQYGNFVDPDGKLGNAFDVHAIPLTITMDASRKVLEVKAGDRDWMAPEYLKKLEGCLAK